MERWLSDFSITIPGAYMQAIHHREHHPLWFVRIGPP
jgi:hypothetical protein